MRVSIAILALVMSTGFAYAETIDADDIVILSVQPRSSDVKPIAIALPAHPAHAAQDHSR